MNTVIRRILLILAVLLLAGCPKDSEPPQVTILWPGDGDTVRGTVTVAVHATDNKEVTAVELYVNSQHHSSDSTGDSDTFRLTWDTEGLALDTFHNIFCDGYDAAGNLGPSDEHQVFVASGSWHAGTVTGPQTWDSTGNPHYVVGELLVRATVSVLPGTEIYMGEDAAITIGLGSNGGLRAIGTEQKPILFTTMAEKNRSAGDWLGIGFMSGADQDLSILRHCVVEYGGGGGWLLYSESAGVVIDSSEFYQSIGNGIEAGPNGLKDFADNTVTSCAGFPLVVHPNNLAAVTTGNTFAGNDNRGIRVRGGKVGRTGTWQNLGLPYYVTGPLSISGFGNPAVTIAEGCSLLLADSALIRVGFGNPGALKALGGVAGVFFSPAGGSPGPAEWPGFEFWELSDPASALDHCYIDRAGNLRSGGAAVVVRGPVSMTNSRIMRSKSCGVKCDNDGFLVFANNVITGCDRYPVTTRAQFAGSLGSGNLLTGNSSDSIEVLEGTIAQHSYWRNQGVPYLVRGRIDVGSNNAPTMTVQQGGTVVFDAGSEGLLVVGENDPGTLSATGKPDSVTFTSTDTVWGSWRGIEIHRLGSGSKLDCCRLLYGGKQEPGILYIERSAPTVQNCRIAHTPNYCIALIQSVLDPDVLRANNVLEDYGEDDILVEE
ncbi:MAG: right-handed parallel beta-helix repeat-containing protein [candidate division WOR-3 bacterium]|nr:MAG: right-handed parallel beta-helix repeat-containing protein [candidate division WOR-3 bacterium]